MFPFTRGGRTTRASHRRRPSISFHLSAAALLLTVLLPIAGASGVLRVQRKFVAADHVSIADFKHHDAHRHSRVLSAVDVPLGGNGLPTALGLYHADITIGSPPQNFTVQVDTGSDILWVNCVPCTGCPTNSSAGIELSIYDPRASKSAKVVGCDEPMCGLLIGREPATCPHGSPCKFRTVYGDGSSSSGNFVTDVLTYGQVSGDNHTEPANASVSFGCAALQTGTSSVGIEGLVGFGQAGSSMISQLASSGKVKKIFAHCLDTTKGGGIFAIGNVVEPKVKTTPLVPDMPHYNVNLKAIEVGSTILQLPSDLFETGDNKGTIIDSGTTLAYLPGAAYRAIIEKIFSNYTDMSFYTIQSFECFRYRGSVDDGFPIVTFRFENSLTLQVHPHDYFFQNKDIWCIGWQDGGDMEGILLGDLALSNKLVLYDLENQVVGWTDYNCSSSIKIEDETNKVIRIVNAHTPSSASKPGMGESLVLLPLAFMLYLLNSLF